MKHNFLFLLLAAAYLYANALFSDSATVSGIEDPTETVMTEEDEIAPCSDIFIETNH